MTSKLLAAVSGALFGVGLVLASMTDPARVLGFLDITRDWDPTLMFVMGGGVISYGILYRLVLKRRTPWCAPAFHLPTRDDLDRRLVLGSALFGVGWGLGGLCPGPGIVIAGAGMATGLVFVAAMIAGMFLQRQLARRTSGT